jgi:stringent starvation protein B
MDQSSDGGATATSTSTRPYLIRALHDWCTDNGFTPYIAVHVDRFVQVPNEYVSNNEIVLNVGFDATSSLELGNDFIQFKARFGGVAREIVVPVDHVVAIYARENGQGMAFPAPSADTPSAPLSLAGSATAPAAATSPAVRPPAPMRGLRLAPEPSAGSQDQPGAPAEAPTAELDEPGPDDSGGAAPGAGRPALKRIK